MQYVLGNMLSGGSGGLNADKLSLDLQFATDKTLTARKGPTPTFTRSSSATFVGSDGLVQTAGINVARFNHTSTGVCQGLLIEEGRTNFALYSGALVNGTGWATAGTTITSSGTGPDNNTAYEVTENAGGTLHTVLNTGGTGSGQVASVTSGTTYTGSIFLKKVSGSVDWVQVTLASTGFGTSQYVNINISNGTIGNSSGGTARVEAYANGWYRVSWSAAAVTTTSSTGTILAAGVNNTNGTTRVPSYSGSASNKFLAAMAQFEVGAFSTSYIPTTNASVVRSADVCSITGTDFSGLYNQSEGAILTNAFTPASGDRTVIAVDDNTANEMIRLRTESTNPFFKVTDGGSEIVDIDSGTVSYNTSFKLAGAYKLNDFASSINGGAAVTDTSGTIPTVDRMRIGAGQGGNTMCGCVASLRYYKKRLTDSKLQSITA
jgi:hypothetical protein